MTNTNGTQKSQAQDTMNQKYSELCQQRGSLSYQKTALDAQLADIDSQIKALNSLAPAMRKLELDLVASNTTPETVNNNNGAQGQKTGAKTAKSSETGKDS